MKILHVEDFFHPEAGYQVNILAKYMQKLGHEVIIVTSELDKFPDYLVSFFGKNNIEEKDAEYTKNYGVKIIRLSAMGYYSGSIIYGRNLINSIEKINPDIVFAHGNDTLTGIRCICYCIRKKICVISDSHMLEIASKNKFAKIFRFVYCKTIAKKINNNKIPVIRTQNDDYAIRCLGIDKKNSPFIPLGSDLMFFHEDFSVKLKMREYLGIKKDDFVFIYAGKLDESKGGLFLAEAFLTKITDKRNVILLVVGSSVGEYGDKVDKMLNLSENTVIKIPSQKYVELAKYYQTADAAVFPKQCSLSFYDVQACGLPVIFEDNSVNMFRSKYENAITFKSDDIDSFRAALKKIVELDDYTFNRYKNNSIKYIVDNYDYKKICEQYLFVIENFFENRR